MWLAIGLGFLAGVIFGNGVPHFVRGITKERYPCMFGGGPVANLIAGWLSFVLATVVAHWVTWGAGPVIAAAGWGCWRSACSMPALGRLAPSD